MGRFARFKVAVLDMVRLAGATDFQARSAFFQDLQLDLCQIQLGKAAQLHQSAQGSNCRLGCTDVATARCCKSAVTLTSVLPMLHGHCKSPFLPSKADKVATFQLSLEGKTSGHSPGSDLGGLTSVQPYALADLQ